MKTNFIKILYGALITVLTAVLILFLLWPLIGMRKNSNSNDMIQDVKNCLVVIDCQNDFITGSLANEEAQKKVPNIVNKIREFNGEAIFVTRDTHTKNYLNTKEGKLLPVVHCVEGTEGWQVEPSIQAALNDAGLRGIKVMYVNKPTFGSRELIIRMSNYLDPAGSNIEICGFCTDICVVSNALLIKEAFYETADITVDGKLCAGVTVDSHKAALTTMQMCQINVVNPEY